MRHASDKKEPRRLIVFTDLDGTLLNHGDYSYDEALPALERLRTMRAHIVICTSKTRQEVVALQRELGIIDPFIVENGGGIFSPAQGDEFPVEGAVMMNDQKCIPLGIPYARIRSFIKQKRSRFSITGFGDMSIDEIAELTGLTCEKAGFAKAREFTEPFVVDNDDVIPSIEREALLKGIRITRGGRFYHFIGFGNDKGEAVRRVQDAFSRNTQSRMISIGIGDSPNDFPMLRQVDIPVLIPHEDGTYEDIDLPGLIRAQFPGSRGWNDAVLKILSEMNGNDKKKRKKKHSA
jgi:mannosyl-3-phosphoglycerate phosphatase